MVPSLPPSAELDVQNAGLPKGSVPGLLAWEQVFALALVRDRAGTKTFAESLDPKALDAESARQGVADFARFRQEFLASQSGAGGTIQDVTREYGELLRRLQSTDNVRRNVAIHENLLQFVVTFMSQESAGLSQLDVDQIFAALVRARQGLAHAVKDYRDGLDQMRVSLGLWPHAAVIPDRRSLAEFARAFEAVESWAKNPKRDLPALTQLVQTLPALGELVIDGQPVLAAIARDQDQEQGVLMKAARIAIASRTERSRGPAAGDGSVRLELQVRSRLRRLIQTQHDYETEKRSYEQAMRLRDQTFERLVSPSTPSASGRSQLLGRLLEHILQAVQAEDRLLLLWTSFRVERLSLYRELGTLPYKDWAGLYQDLSAG